MLHTLVIKKGISFNRIGMVNTPGNHILKIWITARIESINDLFFIPILVTSNNNYETIHTGQPAMNLHYTQTCNLSILAKLK